MGVIMEQYETTDNLSLERWALCYARDAIRYIPHNVRLLKAFFMDCSKRSDASFCLQQASAPLAPVTCFV